MPNSTAAPYVPSCQVPHTHTYLRRAVPTANGARAGEMTSPFHMKAIAAIAAAVAAAQQTTCQLAVSAQITSNTGRVTRTVPVYAHYLYEILNRDYRQ